VPEFDLEAFTRYALVVGGEEAAKRFLKGELQ